jgi:carbohydrate binding protein with CBM6 domain
MSRKLRCALLLIFSLGFILTFNTTGLAQAQPSVTTTNPASGATNVMRDVFVSADVFVPNGGIDPATLTSSTVFLYRTSDLQNVPATKRRTQFSSALLFPNIHAGYTGTGFVDYINASGDYIQWTVSVPTAGSYMLDFRFGNGDATNRPLELRVNGGVANSSLAFPSTGTWTNWSLASAPVSLNAGTNTIRLTAIGSSGGNIDSLTVR